MARAKFSLTLWRPVLVEIQALTVRLASGATPRRAAVGWDTGRLAMILAVLEARCGISFATAEVYLNVAGGYRLSDPAADLAVAAALVSAVSERPAGGMGVPQGILRPLTMPTSAFTDVYVSCLPGSPVFQAGPPSIDARPLVSSYPGPTVFGTTRLPLMGTP